MTTTRRALLIGGIQVALATPFLARGGLPRLKDDEPILVVLQLTGGNDGLNTVVPHRQDAYYTSRPSLALARGSLHPLDDDHGLHPAMQGLGVHFQEGRLAVVHGVGVDDPDRSHFRSMDIWHTASLDPTSDQTGWLGRLADQVSAARPGSLAALYVGDGVLPRSLAGDAYFSPSLRDADSLRLAAPAASDLTRGRERLLRGEPGDANLEFLREAARGTYRAAEKMEELAGRRDGASYPATKLAGQLRLVARLIEGGFGTRIFQLAIGGFDTHARQARTHEGLLREVSGALSAFQDDLRASGMAKRVVTLVFSEFGRRARENGSGGTDHGAGAPVFLLGDRVRGGLHGEAPDLGRLVDGDVPATTDLRSLYRGLEEGWMRLRPSSTAVRPQALTT